MKFAVRLVILAIFALTLSVGLVSAQEETEAGAFVQAASTYTMTVVDDETITLELAGVATATPLLFGDVAGIYPTADFIADWIASGLSVETVINFQLGAPVGATEEGAYVDYTVTATVVPVGEYADGVVTYTVTVVDVAGVSIFGDGPSAVESVEMDKAVDALLGNFVDDALTGENITVLVGANADFLAALSAARVARAEGSRPSGVTAPCIPKVTC